MNGRNKTAEDKRWISFIVDHGCIVCANELGLFSPPSVHHMEGSRKEGCHLLTLPLCHRHHQKGKNNENYVSRHPWKAEFEERYGDEYTLLKQLQDRYAENT